MSTYTLTISGDSPPEDLALANGSGERVAFDIQITRPGLETERRHLDLRELGPLDDVALKPLGFTANEIVANPSNVGLMGIWFLAGRQDDRRESLTELAGMFTNANVKAFRLELTADFEIPLDPDVAADVAADRADAEDGAFDPS